jgi:predicted enzyme related to lactoylglutathione lyase
MAKAYVIEISHLDIDNSTEAGMDKNEIGELMEIIIYVEDMNRQVSFYRDQLGFKVVNAPETADYGKEFWVEFDTGSCTLALHAGGKKRFGADAPKFVFRVQDILAARQELHNQQVEMGEIRSAAPGVWVCDGADPEGNKFSIESHD